MLGHYRPASKPMMAAYSGIWILSPLINEINKNKKTVSVVTPLTKLYRVTIMLYSSETTAAKLGVFKTKKTVINSEK